MAAQRDPFVDAAMANWAPRFIQNGVDYPGFTATVERITTWAQWLPEWVRSADEHAGLAAEAEAAGHGLTAGHAWRRAAVTRHFAKFVWTLDLDLVAEATLRSVDEMRRAFSFLDPTAERIEADLDGEAVVSILRRPAAVAEPRLVVLLPGLDSTKEEFFHLEESFLHRGLATLTIDGPGQGETGLRIPMRGDYHRAVTATLDEVARSVDGGARLVSGVAVCGISLGGFYAPHVAAHENRVRVMAAVSGPYAAWHKWDEMPPISKRAFIARTHSTTADEAFQVVRQLDLTGLCERIEAVSLYVTGDQDRIVPWQQTERQAKETPNASFVLYPGGNHVLSNLPHRARPMIADWITDQMKLVED